MQAEKKEEEEEERTFAPVRRSAGTCRARGVSEFYTDEDQPARPLTGMSRAIAVSLIAN